MISQSVANIQLLGAREQAKVDQAIGIIVALQRKTIRKYDQIPTTKTTLQIRNLSVPGVL